MHSLNLLSDLLDPKNKTLLKSIEVISKLQTGIVVIVRNPRKELLKNERNRLSNKKILKSMVGAQILIDLGVKKITLLTSSTKNIIGIDGFGLKISGTKKI